MVTGIPAVTDGDARGAAAPAPGGSPGILRPARRGAVARVLSLCRVEGVPHTRTGVALPHAEDGHGLRGWELLLWKLGPPRRQRRGHRSGMDGVGPLCGERLRGRRGQCHAVRRRDHGLPGRGYVAAGALGCGCRGGPERGRGLLRRRRWGRRHGGEQPDRGSAEFPSQKRILTPASNASEADVERVPPISTSRAPV